MNTLPKIALGAWAWGNDGTFGGNLTADALRPIFEAGIRLPGRHHDALQHHPCHRSGGSQLLRSLSL